MCVCGEGGGGGASFHRLHLTNFNLSFHILISSLVTEYMFNIQGGHIFEKLNSLSFPSDFQGV